MTPATFDQTAMRPVLDALGDAVVAAAWGVSTMVLLAVVVVVAYLVKSKLGINLMDGPSPLHGLYLMIR